MANQKHNAGEPPFQGDASLRHPCSIGEPGFCTIYIIRCGEDGPFKIGRARNVYKRLSNLQSAHHELLHLVGWFEGHESYEGSLHMLFDDTRIRGEWYRGSDALHELIAACQQRQGKAWADKWLCEMVEREEMALAAIKAENAKQMLARLKAEREATPTPETRNA